MKKRPPLSRKREAYVSERASGILVGAPLHYPAAPEARYRNELDKLIAPMVRQYEREMRLLWRQYGPELTMDASLASQARMALRRLQDRFARLFAKRAPTIVDKLLGGIDKAAANSLEQSLKQLSGGVTLKVAAMPAALAEAMKASAIENVALIKSIPAQYHERIEGAVMRSIQAGGEGRKTLFDEITDIGGMSRRRAELIARDQTAKITTVMHKERAKAAGIRKFKWLHSSASAEPRRKHVEANGKIYEYDNPPRIGDRGEPVLPGQAINCHPGDSEIEIPSGCVKLYRRRYSGELLSLVSDDGVILKATPNHPVLTAEGWKAAKDVNLGDYLIKSSNQCVNASEVDVQRAVAEFAQAFDSAARLIGVGAASESRSVAFEFHGDVSDSEVDIVDIGRFLPDELNPGEVEHVRELILSFADAAFNSLAERHFSPADEFIVVQLLAPDRSVGGLCALLAELRGEPAGADDICSRLIAYLDSAINQDAANRCSGCAVFVRKLKLAHSEGVLSNDLIARQILAIVSLGFSSRDAQAPLADRLGQVVCIDPKFGGDGSQGANPVEHAVRVTDKLICKDFAGHVYNLETVANWYVANGIVTHNCRCVAVPVLEWGDD